MLLTFGDPGCKLDGAYYLIFKDKTKRIMSLLNIYIKKPWKKKYEKKKY